METINFTFFVMVFVIFFTIFAMFFNSFFTFLYYTVTSEKIWFWFLYTIHCLRNKSLGIYKQNIA